MEKIDSRHISVIVQGPLHRGKPEGIERCLASIRRVLPFAEIIVSTWESEEVEGLEADKVIRSKDPGCFLDHRGNGYNLNRQLVSTLAGLRAATRPYGLKFRADLALVDDSFCVIRAANAESTFQSPLTVTNLYIRHPERYPLIYHMTDIVHFGRREDLLEYWEGPVFSEGDVLSVQPFKPPIGSYLALTRTRLVPEQALTLRWLRKSGIEVSLAHPWDATPQSLRHWATVLTRDFHIVDWVSSGILYPERFTSPAARPEAVVFSDEVERIRRDGFSYPRTYFAVQMKPYLQPVFYYMGISRLVLRVSPSLHASIKGVLQRLRRSSAHA